MPTSKNRQFVEDDVNQWDENGVTTWLRSVKLDFCIEEFRSLHIDGQRLLVNSVLCIYILYMYPHVLNPFLRSNHYLT